MNVVVLASGRGSNFEALARAIDAGECAARIIGLVSDRPSAAALELAASRGIATAVVPLHKGDDRDAWNVELAERVAALGGELLVLAGFMRILGPPLLERYRGRIINVHPALLPSFPGAHGARDALAAGVRVSGCTVHVVDEGVDTGPILAQAALPVLPDDDEDSLHARIQIREHRLLPTVVDWIGRGWLELSPPRFTRPMRPPGAELIWPNFED